MTNAFDKPPSPSDDFVTKQAAEALLEIVGELLTEIHPDLPAQHKINLDSSFARNLGLDSLARVELVHRVEQSFKVKLSDDVFASANSPRELLAALTNASGPHLDIESKLIDADVEKPLSSEKISQHPTNATTLIEVLDWHVQQHPERQHIKMYSDQGEGESITYDQLARKSYQVAWGLLDHQIKKNAKVTIMLPTSPAYFFSFLGVLAAGAVAVPIYPPMRLSQIESYIHRHKTILANSQAEIMITSKEVKRFATLVKSLLPGLRLVLSFEDFSHYSEQPTRLKLDKEDIAFIQYTSGSTSDPKGVQLSHGNLLANIEAMGTAINLTSDDIFVSWLPLYHDMGLIGAWLGIFYRSALLVIMSPLEFLVRPQRWLWAIHRYQATISAAPNFAYELCLHKISDEQLKGLDLSSWRIACNGAEPVIPRVIRMFCERFAEYGFRKSSMWPVYGLAESSVGLAFPKPDKTPYIDRVDRALFIKKGIAKKAPKSEPNTLEFVACGQALSQHQIRVVDDMGFELPDRREGHLQFKGPSSTRGYYREPEKTQALFKGDWLDTGDLAYLDNGVLFLTGRTKDIIIRAGRNIYPHELEEVVGNVEGIRRGRVVAFGYQDKASGKEKLVILTEKRTTSDETQVSLRQKIVAACSDIIDLPPDDIVFAAPNTILKTSSGKLRRSACKALYLSGKLKHKPPLLWWQLGRLFLSAIKQQLNRLWQNLKSLLFAGYCWFVYFLLAGVSLLFFLLPVSQKTAQKFGRIMTRFLIWVTTTQVEINGLENIQTGQSDILVANHCSYLDAYLLLATLPIPFRFVAKAELSRQPLITNLLQRLGVVFVERSELKQSISDINDIKQIEESLLFFPEGTFSRVPGLGQFHLGAFISAINNNKSVIPISISGTRDMLRSDSWFPRKTKLYINILPATQADNQLSDEWQQANGLKNKVRKQILDSSHEPDLQ